MKIINAAAFSSTIRQASQYTSKWKPWRMSYKKQIL
jgi:hypothetical protein